MDREIKEKVASVLILAGFFTESVFGGLAVFNKYISAPVSPQIVAEVAVKGISVNTYDNVLNFAYMLLVISANVIAISLVVKHGIKKIKKE